MDFDAAREYVLKRLEKELPQNLYYHGPKHTLGVIRGAGKIAQAEGVCGEELILLKTAALYHDTGFMTRYRDNEILGAELAASTLPSFGYAPGQIKRIQDMIMSTAFPQTPKNKLSEILCDADLDYLGTASFYSVSGDFRRELGEYGIDFSERDWIKFEIDFMQAHKYFTQTARKRRNALKNRHIRELKASYEQFD